MTVASILKDHKKFNKLCSRLNKDFGCKDAYLCGVSCPLWMAREIEWQINNKNLSLGEAYRTTLRDTIDVSVRKRILRTYAEKLNVYPHGDIDKIMDKIMSRVMSIINEVLDEHSIREYRASESSHQDRRGNQETKKRYGNKSIKIRSTTKSHTG